MEKEELKNEKVKKERVFTTKDLVFTAIIACLIGAIITAGGFAIFNKNHRRGDFRDLKQDGIQTNMGPREFNNSNNNKNMRQLPQGNNQNNNQNNSEQAPNTQNPPSDAPNQSTPNNQSNNSSESKT